MRYSVVALKSLNLALAELKPFILNGIHLQKSRGFKRMNGMRSREMLSNWLLCAVINSHLSPDRMTFTSAPEAVGGDGILVDRLTNIGFPTEHVIVAGTTKNEGRDAHELILEAIRHKLDKGGASYAAGKVLIVLLFQGAGQWHPNRVARQLPDPILFEAVWVTSLHSVMDGRYTYNVTKLDLSEGNAPAWCVEINDQFDAWTITRIQ